VSPIFANHDVQRQQPQQHQQQCSVSPDDVTTSLQVHKYPWMSIIGKFNSLSSFEYIDRMAVETAPLQE